MLCKSVFGKHEVGPAHMPSWMVEELKKLYPSLGALCQLVVVGDVLSLVETCPCSSKYQ